MLAFHYISIKAIMNHQTLFNIPFLASRWENNYTEFKASGKDGELRAKLRNWNDRKVLSETASEAAFIKLLSVQTLQTDYRRNNTGGERVGYEVVENESRLLPLTIDECILPKME